MQLLLALHIKGLGDRDAIWHRHEGWAIDLGLLEYQTRSASVQHRGLAGESPSLYDQLLVLTRAPSDRKPLTGESINKLQGVVSSV